MSDLPCWVQVGPPKPPSPVPEGIEEEASPAKVTSLKDDSAAPSDAYAQERSRLRADLQKVSVVCWEMHSGWTVCTSAWTGCDSNAQSARHEHRRPLTTIDTKCLIQIQNQMPMWAWREPCA